MGHDEGRLTVLALLGGLFGLLSGRRRFRLGLRLSRGQLLQLPLGLDLPDGPAHRGLQLIGVHRLEQVVAGPQMHRLVGVLEQAVGRHEDDPAGGPLGQHSAGCVEAAHPWHLDVHEDEVCVPQHRRVGSLAAVLGHLQDHFPLKAALDEFCKRLPFQFFIIRDQQPDHRPIPPPKVLLRADTY